MEGTSTRLPNGRWVQIQLDLLGQLHLKPGDKITGLAFSSDNADVIYDSVYLLPDGVTPGVSGGFQGDETVPVVPSGGRDYTYTSPGGRDYTWQEPTGVPTASAPLRIEACIDGGDWIKIENGLLTHQHGSFDQIGSHAGCPASHKLAGGGLLINGARTPLAQLPKAVGISSLGRFEVEQGRGSVRMDGSNRIHIYDQDGGPSIYILRLYPGAEAVTPPAAKGAVLFDNGNIAGVDNGPSQPTSFSLNTAHVITLIQDYHWNSARGATPGTIGLRDANGRIYGPWQSVGSPGQGGVPNAYWTVRPDITLPAGNYSVIDSHPASWSRNGGSQQRGFTRVEGYPTNDASGREYSYPAPQSSAISPSSTAEPSIEEQAAQALRALKGLFGK
jgi:hypothetical protein